VDLKMNVENRTIFEGDNLHIPRGLDSETIDLIYLDPPFNSNKTYEAPIGSDAAGAAFKDSWTLSDLDDAWHGELAESEPALYSAISAAEFTHSKSMKAYLIMMGIRMLEMKRVLKDTGSIYLHCDPTASHYLKTMMDAVFGQRRYKISALRDGKQEKGHSVTR
jgi:site-specific DNA-methyltransferase (adenine-specific)